VTIKEKVELKPQLQGKGPGVESSVWWPEPGFLTFERGGMLTIGLAFPEGSIPCLLNERAIPESVHDPGIPWGRYSQWQGSTFTLRTKDPPDNPVMFVPHDQSSSLIGGLVNSGFLIYARPETPDIISTAVWLLLDPDSSEAMPPQWYLDYDYGPGNPFDKTLAPVVELPFDCYYRITVTVAKPTATDDLFMTQPVTRLLWRNAANHAGESMVVGPLPRGTPFQLALVSGVQTLVKGDTLYPQAGDFGAACEFHFEDWTDESFDDVIVTVQPDAGPPDHLEITAATNPIWYGDTVAIAIKPTDVAGNLSPLGFDSDFEYSIELLPESVPYGTLLYNGESGTYFDHIPSAGGMGVGVQFAANGLEPDSVVTLQFHLREYYSGGIIPSFADKRVSMQGTLAKAIKPSARIALTSRVKGKSMAGSVLSSVKPRVRTQSVDYLENDYGYGLGEDQIMLGETRYYQARQVDYPAPYLVLEDVTPTSRTAPPVLKGGRSDIEYFLVNGSGGKLGTYYEYKYPVYTGGSFVKMENLQTGLIRLVGRYWKDGTKPKVYLWARSTTDQNIIGHRIITVVKPGKLLSGSQSPTYARIKDVFALASDVNPNLDLDALVVKYAGENGIPPQLIKGQMLKETALKPAWRYEPFLDVKLQSNDEKLETYFDESLPFVVTETSMGNGDWPTLHTNSSPTPYISTPISASEFVTTHWDRYVRRGSGNTPDNIIGSVSLTARWKELYQNAKKKKGTTDAQARQKAHDNLQDEILDADTDLGGQFDVMAQTRKATSYGFIQMMYITAVDNRFYKETEGRYAPTGTPYVDQNNSQMFPEKLNEQDFFMPRYSDFLLKKLNFTFTGATPSSQWDDGFEARWKAALKKYNPGEKTYGNDVLSNAERFLPSK